MKARAVISNNKKRANALIFGVCAAIIPVSLYVEADLKMASQITQHLAGKVGIFHIMSPKDCRLSCKGQANCNQFGLQLATSCEMSGILQSEQNKWGIAPVAISQQIQRILAR